MSSTLSMLARYVPELAQAIVDFRKGFAHSDKQIVLWHWGHLSSLPKCLSIILKQSEMIDDLLLENGIQLGMPLIDAIEQVKNCPSFEDTTESHFSTIEKFYVWDGSGEEAKRVSVSSREHALNLIASYLLINKGV